MKIKPGYVVGIMSGTSLDGIDLALCHFELQDKEWKYKIISSKTYSYSQSWRKRLRNTEDLSGNELIIMHKQYGELLAQTVLAFLNNSAIKPSLIASHGHTIYHQPSQKYTLQIGDGAVIAAQTGIPTVSDFRSTDVALGGQGAPLVPIGDELLFSNFDYCINLGGFANISYKKDMHRYAYDVCPVNIVLNHLANDMGMDFDENGAAGKKGIVIDKLLSQLNALDYYQKMPPKSLGKEWLQCHFIPLLDKCKSNTNDILRTVYEHITVILSKSFDNNSDKSVLLTGGGSHNSFLIDLLTKANKNQFVIPDKITIDYKEAMVFAFLGFLRVNKQINCLSSVTGASRDSVGGGIYIP